MRLLLFLCAALLAALCPVASRADDYMQPNWPNLTRALVRFNALKLDENVLIDEYTVITECDMYQAFYSNDFKWNQVRKAVMSSIAMNVATFPTKFRYETKFQLDRYDFTSRIFRFTDKTTMRNVNTFGIYATEGNSCGADKVNVLPHVFRAVVAEPLYMDGLPISEKEASDLIKQMNLDGNPDRIVYVRFNFAVVYIDPIRKVTIKAGPDPLTEYIQSNNQMPQSARLDVRLDSLDFYEDPQMTKLIYEYKQ